MGKTDILTQQQQESLRLRFDSDGRLQAKYAGDFQAFLRTTIIENEKVAGQIIQVINPQHCFGI